MPLILGAQSATAAGYSIDNGVRFNGTNQGLVRTSPSDTPTSLYKFTVSFWAKRDLESSSGFFTYTHGASTPYESIYFQTNGEFFWVNHDGTESTKLVTSAQYRDVSAWYNFVLSYDSTPATPSSTSIKMFVNGTQITAFGTETYPPQNTVQYMCVASQSVPIGYYPSSGWYAGYYSEIMVVDGQALDAESFGEFDSDSPTIWKPIDISGIDVGAQGFYLEFKDSSNLGKLSLGNGSDFTSTALTAVNQATDSPTNNFCVMNPSSNYLSAATFSLANLKILTGSSPMAYLTGTFGLSAGLWYYEVMIDATNGHDVIGIAEDTPIDAANFLGEEATQYSYYGYNGKSTTNNTQTSYGDTYTAGDVIGVYIDLSANKIYWAKNGTIQNSGTGVSITAVGSTLNQFYYPALGDWASSATSTYSVNFGNPPWALTSAVNDSNGYGNFEYSPNDGGSASFDGSAKDFLAICTKNLATDGG